jgi:hypothetical protein
MSAKNGCFAPKRSCKRNANCNAAINAFGGNITLLAGNVGHLWQSLGVRVLVRQRLPGEKGPRSRKQAVEADIQNNHDD